jgi:cytochrome P450
MAVAALVRHFPQMQLAGETLRYRPASVLRGLEALPVTLGA